MQVTYIVVVTFIAYVIAEISKVFSIPTRYVPIVNLGVGIVSAAVCYFIGVLPSDSPMSIAAGLISCVVAACGAGGFYDLLNTKTKEMQMSADDADLASINDENGVG